MATKRQVGQRARRSNEHRSMQQRSPIGSQQLLVQPADIDPTNRELAQRARQIRENQSRLSRLSMDSEPLLTRHNDMASTDMRSARQEQRIGGHHYTERQLPFARRQLLSQSIDDISPRHRLHRCDISCIFCGAEHWVDERIQASTLGVPKFSTCCMSGVIIMDRFEDPPQPLYSLLKEDAPGMFFCPVFTDRERQLYFVKIFEIITTLSHSARSESNKICLFMDLKEYTLFVFKDNCVIEWAPFFIPPERILPFLKSTSIVQIPANKCNSVFPIIMICLTSPSFMLFKVCSDDRILISKCS